MAKFFDQISPAHAEFIGKQHVFFVASAPLAAESHVNLSPKGLDSFRILGPNSVAYLDLTGSGNETSAHLMENGRITIMFCAFSGNPLILRLYGRGDVVLPDTERWAAFAPHFTLLPGARQIIAIDVYSVQTSCGFAVPKLEYREDRQKLVDWAEQRGEDGLVKYRRDKNVCSIDGLPTPLGERLTGEHG
jgi:hypothetical protein